MPRFMFLVSRFIYVLLAAIAAVLVVFVSQNWGITLPLVVLGHTSKALPLAMWVLMALGLGSITALLIAGLIPSSQGERSPVSRPASRFSSRSARPTPPSDAPRSPSARTSAAAWDDWQADPPRRSSSSSRQGPEQFASWSRDSQEKPAPTSTQRDRPRSTSTNPQPWGETWERPWQRKWESWEIWAETGSAKTQGDRPDNQPPVTDAEVISASPPYEAAGESVYESAYESDYASRDRNAAASTGRDRFNDAPDYAPVDYASVDYSNADYGRDPDYDSEVNDAADEFEMDWQEEADDDRYPSPPRQKDGGEDEVEDEFDDFDDLEELDDRRQDGIDSDYSFPHGYEETFIQDDDIDDEPYAAPYEAAYDQGYGDRYDDRDGYDDQDRYEEGYEGDRYPNNDEPAPAAWDNWVAPADDSAIAQAWYVPSDDNLGEYDDDYAADVIDVEAKVADDDLGDELENWDDWETEGDRSKDPGNTPMEPANDTANIYEVHREPVIQQQQGTLYSYVYRKPDEQDNPSSPSADAEPATAESISTSTESTGDRDRILIPPYHPDPSPDSSASETVETSDVEAEDSRPGKPVSD